MGDWQNEVDKEKEEEEWDAVEKRPDIVFLQGTIARTADLCVVLYYFIQTKSYKLDQLTNSHWNVLLSAFTHVSTKHCSGNLVLEDPIKPWLSSQVFDICGFCIFSQVIQKY